MIPTVRPKTRKISLYVQQHIVQSVLVVCNDCVVEEKATSGHLNPNGCCLGRRQYMVKRLNAGPGMRMRKFKVAFGDVKVESTVLHAPQS